MEKVDMKTLYIGWSILPPEGEAAEASSAQPSQVDSITAAFRRFSKTMRHHLSFLREAENLAVQSAAHNTASFLSYVKEIARIEKTSISAGKKPIASLSVRLSTPENKSDVLREIKYGLFGYDQISNIREYGDHSLAASSILHGSFLQQIVNAWEHLLGEFVLIHLKSQSDDVSKEKMLSYRDIIELGSIEAVKDKILNDEIADFLRSKSTKEQLKYIKDNLKVDLQTHFSCSSQLTEIVLRRHAVVHTAGRVNADYLKRVKGTGFYSGKLPDLGSPLHLNDGYTRKAWDVIYAAGAVLMHQIGRETARRSRDSGDDEEEFVDSSLVNETVFALNDETIGAAEFVYKYAEKLTFKDDMVRLVAKVNTAIMHILIGDQKKADAVLCSVNWQSASALFQMSVAALRGQFDEFERLLPSVAANKDCSVEDMYEWPVFFVVRKNQRFTAVVEAAFNGKATERHRPRLLGVAPLAAPSGVTISTAEFGRAVLHVNHAEDALNRALSEIFIGETRTAEILPPETVNPPPPPKKRPVRKKRED